jgi:hypothetical protein
MGRTFLTRAHLQGDPVGERTVDVAKVRSSAQENDLVVANIYVKPAQLPSPGSCEPRPQGQGWKLDPKGMTTDNSMP